MQWTITINFVSCKDNGEECVMNSKSDSIELYDSLIKKYQIGLENSMKGSDFIFDCVYLLYYKCHKRNPNHDGSYIDSPEWVKNKKQ